MKLAFRLTILFILIVQVVNAQQKLPIILEVHLEGREPYVISQTKTVPLSRLAQMQIGSEVEVVTDAQDYKIMIRW